MRAQHLSPPAYQWQLGASPGFRRIFISFNLLAALLLALNLRLPWFCVCCCLLFAFSVWAARSHHALWGKPFKLLFNQGQWFLLEPMADGSLQRMPLQLLAYRALGTALVSLMARPLAAWFSRPVLMLADNSTTSQRHRLALYYQSHQPQNHHIKPAVTTLDR